MKLNEDKSYFLALFVYLIRPYMYICNTSDQGLFRRAKDRKFRAGTWVTGGSSVICVAICQGSRECCAAGFRKLTNECYLVTGDLCFDTTDIAVGWDVYHKIPLTKQFITTKKNWADAQLHCQALGGRLATVSSYFENEFMKDLTDGTQTWLGGSDQGDEGHWTWRNPTVPMKGYPWYWVAGNPDNSRNAQHCLAYYTKNGYFAWADEECYEKKSFICE